MSVPHSMARCRRFVGAALVILLADLAQPALGAGQAASAPSVRILRIDQVARLLEAGTTVSGLVNMLRRGLCYLGPAPGGDTTERLVWLGATDSLFRALTDARCRPTRLLVSPSRASLIVGEELPLAATVYVGNGVAAPDFPVRFESLDRGVVAVRADGTLRGVGAGATRVRVTAEGSVTSDVEVGVEAPLMVAADREMAEARVGEPYRSTLAASGGSGQLRWRLAAGVLAPGLRIEDDGTIAGTPTAAGTYSFRVAVGNTRQTADQEFRLQVSPAAVVAESRPAIDSAAVAAAATSPLGPPPPAVSQPDSSTSDPPNNGAGPSGALQALVVAVEVAVKSGAMATLVDGGEAVDQFVAKGRRVREVKVGPAAGDVGGNRGVAMPLRVVVDRGFGTTATRHWTLTLAAEWRDGAWRVRAVALGEAR